MDTITPITLEEAAAMLGGKGEPWPVRDVKQMIKAGVLASIGKGKKLRTFRECVDEFLTLAAKGKTTWPPRDHMPLPMSSLARELKAAESLASRPLVARPPKRSTQK
jgi:hypothetical protein